MDIRRIQVTGGSSYMVTLPKDWADKVGVTKNSAAGNRALAEFRFFPVPWHIPMSYVPLAVPLVPGPDLLETMFMFMFGYFLL